MSTEEEWHPPTEDRRPLKSAANEEAALACHFSGWARVSHFSGRVGCAAIPGPDRLAASPDRKGAAKIQYQQIERNLLIDFACLDLHVHLQQQVVDFFQLA